MKPKQPIVVIGLVLGVTASVLLTVVPSFSGAARSSGGTYSLPTGNPVVTGTTITSTWANATLADLATATTNSLDRTGATGGMTGPLHLYSGSVVTPGLNFSSETNTGIYRNAPADIRLTVESTDVQQWTDATSTFGRGLIANQVTTNGAAVTATGHAADGGAILATGGPPNGVGVYSTGSGTAVGGWFNGGTSNGDGIKAVGGATNGFGASIQGTGTGVGAFVNGGGATTTYAQFTSAITGSASAGGLFASNANGSHGVVGWGTGAGSGVYGKAGGSGYGGEFDGNVKFRNADPAATTGFTNTATPLSLVKCWGLVTCNGAGCVLTSGFNTASIATSNSGGTKDLLTVTIADDMASANYAVIFSVGGLPANTYVPTQKNASRAAGSFAVQVIASGGFLNFDTSNVTVSYMVLGAQ